MKWNLVLVLFVYLVQIAISNAELNSIQTKEDLLERIGKEHQYCTIIMKYENSMDQKDVKQCKIWLKMHKTLTRMAEMRQQLKLHQQLQAQKSMLKMKRLMDFMNRNY